MWEWGERPRKEKPIDDRGAAEGERESIYLEKKNPYRLGQLSQKFAFSR